MKTQWHIKIIAALLGGCWGCKTKKKEEKQEKRSNSQWLADSKSTQQQNLKWTIYLSFPQGMSGKESGLQKQQRNRWSWCHQKERTRHSQLEWKCHKPFGGRKERKIQSQQTETELWSSHCLLGLTPGMSFLGPVVLIHLHPRLWILTHYSVFIADMHGSHPLSYTLTSGSWRYQPLSCPFPVTSQAYPPEDCCIRLTTSRSFLPLEHTRRQACFFPIPE